MCVVVDVEDEYPLPWILREVRVLDDIQNGTFIDKRYNLFERNPSIGKQPFVF